MRPFSFTMLPSGAPRIDDFPGMTVSAIQTRPFSRGEVRISSPDPKQRGTIDANYLSDPRDIQVLTRGIARIREIVRQPAIADRVASLALRVRLELPVAVTGGVAMNSGVVRALEARLETRVSVPEDPQLTGALGAAMIARDRLEERDG